MTVVCILFAERILKRKDESKCFFGRVSFSPLGGKRFAPFMLRMKKNMRSLRAKRTSRRETGHSPSEAIESTATGRSPCTAEKGTALGFNLGEEKRGLFVIRVLGGCYHVLSC